MNETVKLLERVAEAAHTGADACGELLEKTKDPGLRGELAAQRADYQNFARDAEQALFVAGGRLRAPGPVQRAGMWMGLQLNTLMDASPEHVADIAIQGATMGVIDMTRDRSDLPDANADAQGLASGLITAQQNAIERLKKFL